MYSKGSKLRRRFDKGRDVATYTVCNWLLRMFATKDYQRVLAVTYALGIQEIDRIKKGQS